MGISAVSRERSKSKQLFLNMTTSFMSVVISMCISFFLTPFVVGNLGADAYGFVGLSNNIISYTQLITIALNSMAGRFITIKYSQGKQEEANKYFSSVFYSNLILCGIIIVMMIGCVYYLEVIFEVPKKLVYDVKLLFSLLVINTVIGIFSNIYAVSTFIKNRLELSSLRNVFGGVINAVLLLIFFNLFEVKLWFIGIAGIAATVYTAFMNYRYKLVLTPDLHVTRKDFDQKCVWELIQSGVWNVVSKVGEILQRGLDLVLANLFIGATEMGILSITTNIPFIILHLFSSISASFAPSLTTSYAKDNINEMVNDLSKSIRILSICMLIPLSAFYVYGDVFYSLWVPSQDALLLQRLTICGTFALIFTSPLENFWNIFTITNKVKYSSLFILFNSIVVFLTVIILLYIAEDNVTKMFIIASTRSIWGVFRGVLFLPIYGAKCLHLRWNYFYSDLTKPILSLVLIIIMMFTFRYFFIPNNWVGLIVMFMVIAVMSLILGSIFIMTKKDKSYISSKVYAKFKK